MSNEEQKHSVTVWLIIETSGGQDTSKYMDPKRGGKARIGQEGCSLYHIHLQPGAIMA